MTAGLARRLRDQRGITVTNVVVVAAIMGILAIPMARFLASNLRNVTSENKKVASQEDLQTAMNWIERDFTALNQVDVAAQNTGPGTAYSLIRFRMGASQSPAYNPLGDADGDGLTNDRDFDDDGDAALVTPPMGQQPWQIGDDLQDDDDDNDGNYDAICQYSVDAEKQLVRQCAFNATGNLGAFTFPVSTDPALYKVLAKDVSRFSLAHFGAFREDISSRIDHGSDGLPGTADADGSEGDQIITAREMDWVLPANGGAGDRSGGLNGPELNHIYAVRVELAQDKNGDGQADFHLSTEVAPPLLPLKRRL